MKILLYKFNCFYFTLKKISNKKVTLFKELLKTIEILVKQENQPLSELQQTNPNVSCASNAVADTRNNIRNIIRTRPKYR